MNLPALRAARPAALHPLHLSKQAHCEAFRTTMALTLLIDGPRTPASHSPDTHLSRPPPSASKVTPYFLLPTSYLLLPTPWW